MKTRSRRVRHYDERIRQILLRDWDPIGVGHRRECQDEYDRYVGSVDSLLRVGVPPEVVAKHLALLETEQMGLSGSPAANLAVAKTLCALNLEGRVS
jgi:hypothetical protein